MKQLRGSVGQHVLLVEDETRLRDMLLRATREMGFQPAGAQSAEQALRLMEQQTYPVVVVDLNLPGAGGMEFLKDVRQRWPQTQAVILTGFGDLDAARQAIHLDVADFLTKPCALGDLEIALDRAFQRLRHAEPNVPDREADDWDELDTQDEIEVSRPPAAERGRLEPDADAEGATGTLKFTPREGSAALSMEDVERQTILTVLEKHGSNRAAAAAELGISVRKLYYRLAQYQKKGLRLP